jgi:type III restriction enzyme
MAKTSHFQFDPNQEHQVRAIEGAVGLFEGFPRQESAFQLGDDIVPNLAPYETLEESWLLDNLNTSRAEMSATTNNPLPPLMTLDVDDGLVLEGTGIDSWRFPVYTVEMETGTGKTYVYLRTIYELRKNYGWRKFIIVVPSIAIFEGVRQSFEDMKEHFKSLYDNETVHLSPYSSQQISRLRSFASSSFTEILVMTLDAFNKSSNNIYKPTEKLPGERLPYQYIQETRPILILDESQNYLSSRSREALRTLHPLFAINYSATPGEKPNLLYRLSPVDAFRLNLVKKIEVMGVTEEQNYNIPQLSFQFLEPTLSYGLPSIEATLNVYKDGQMRQEKIRLKKGEKLYDKTKNPQYKGLEIEEVNIKDGILRFTNGESLVLEGGSLPSRSKEEIFRIQIRETIKAHFRKQKEMLPHGIKVLSLFFIDRVANYTAPQAIIPKLFDEEYENLKLQYPFFKGWSAAEVRESYFAKITKPNQPDEFLDTGIENSDKTQKEKDLEKAAYELIMKGKKRLLNFDEKKSFIFAHSALKEGWDNPNVFQICTLNTTYSENKKRQEIGRGLRLAVNQNGERIQDEYVNVLTVIANESYESYANQLQQDYRVSGDTPPPAPTNARRQDAVRNDDLFNSADFQQFWEHLSRRTDYRIHLDTEALIGQCTEVLNNKSASFPEPKIVVSKGRFVITEFVVKLLEVKVNLALIEIKITDTEGNVSTHARWYKEGDNIARIAKDERLKGFQVVEIKEAGPHSLVHFGDHESLPLGGFIHFSSEKGQVTDPRSVQEAPTNYPVFNLIERTAAETKLTRNTVLRIFKGLRKEIKEKIFRNPEGFSGVFLGTIREILASQVAERIEYTLSDDTLEQMADVVFPSTKRFPQKELIYGAPWSLYDQVQIDSDIERRFVEHRLNEDDKVVCYFKFPNLFKVQMPKIIGNYNPDWGIIRWDHEGKLKLELVRETKGASNPNLLQYPNEKRKIDCAGKHFQALGVRYRHIKGDELNWWEG